ncbi:hypothetical protein BCR44DRAFT_1036550 [Catenaria anguillulae PL171]|uniref:Uncharacterized protein n=1 Tax=Catenaria anguillulae PL171 TaxID=765915 RepID=A0A1Y2HV30_9FUNG|nr:hypothetical protein BCR44DRAFT_1036550 [Catenaria anguillulae PL171]
MNSPASRRFHLVWYISGHGFGHASRCGLLLNHLLLPATSPQLADCSVEVVTFAPAHLFTNLIDTCGHRFTLRRPICRLDAGVIQKDPVTMDVTLSIAEAQAFVANDYARLVSDEVARLASLTHTLDSRQLVILSDASFAPAQIAQELLVPSLLCTNFTWDSIYLSMLQHPPSLPPPAWIQSMTQSYSLFTHWLLESGQLPWPTISARLIRHPFRSLRPLPTFPCLAAQRPLTSHQRYFVRNSGFPQHPSWRLSRLAATKPSIAWFRTAAVSRMDVCRRGGARGYRWPGSGHDSGARVDARGGRCYWQSGIWDLY